MNKITLIYILGTLILFLVVFLVVLTRKPKEKKNIYAKDLLLIKKAKIKKNDIEKVKVEPLTVKTERFNIRFKKLTQKMKIAVNDIVLSEETQEVLKDIKDVKKTLLEGILDISKRRKEIAETITQ